MISIFWSSSRSLIIHEFALVMLKVSIIFLFKKRKRKIAIMFDVKFMFFSFFFPSFETEVHKHHGPRCSLYTVLRRATNDSN